MPSSKKHRPLIRYFSIQKFLADTNLAKHCCSRCRVKPQPTWLISGIGFLTRSQVEFVEAARVNNRMAADTVSLLFQFTKKSEVGIKKKCLAVGIINVLGLDKKGTTGPVRLLDAQKIQAGLE